MTGQSVAPGAPRTRSGFGILANPHAAAGTAAPQAFLERLWGGRLACRATGGHGDGDGEGHGL